jgi:hypothetical protein
VSPPGILFGRQWLAVPLPVVMHPAHSIAMALTHEVATSGSSTRTGRYSEPGWYGALPVSVEDRARVRDPSSGAVRPTFSMGDLVRSAESPPQSRKRPGNPRGDERHWSR